MHVPTKNILSKSSIDDLTSDEHTKWTYRRTSPTLTQELKKRRGGKEHHRMRCITEYDRTVLATVFDGPCDFTPLPIFDPLLLLRSHSSARSAFPPSSLPPVDCPHKFTVSNASQVTTPLRKGYNNVDMFQSPCPSFRILSALTFLLNFTLQVSETGKVALVQ
ncbi:hypothetical protein BDV36DRAFT_85454 [Aspergillus pseudocaelatus]|uniref:Uncharacterized protein n=1 Tax=Aspergillus pseudocaelatus TaxID=1825620 RepID=A0ABQ6W2V9_9EURO|nr:hypothetical protein BDV36DRAFT_85454 [Aspergillus pseudocaelatus]